MSDADEKELPDELRRQRAVAAQVLEERRAEIVLMLMDAPIGKGVATQVLAQVVEERRAEEDKKRLADSRYAVKFWAVVGIVCVVLIYACSDSPESSYRSSPGGDRPSQQVHTPRGDW